MRIISGWDTRSLAAAACIAFVLGAVAGCTETNAPSTHTAAPIRDLIVSPPVHSDAPALADVSDLDAFVSLPPGSVRTGTRAVIRNGAAGTPDTVDLVDGGFDPVAIPARVGDTIFVDIAGADGGTSHGEQVVVANRPPRVVRTSPAPGKKDVPLNAVIVVVFSAPIDPSTLSTSSIQLFRGSEPVAGSVHAAGFAGLFAEFDPDTALAPRSAYHAVVTADVRDVNGQPLQDAPVTVKFSSGDQSLSVAVSGTAFGLRGSGLVLRLNDSEDLPVASNGTFTFATAMPDGAFYSVTALTLPSGPAQLCVVLNGEGIVEAGAATRILVSCTASNAPFTGQILFSSSDGGAATRIQMLDLDRSTITPLTDGSADDGDPAWSPDHTRIAFDRIGDPSVAGVWVMNADGSAATRISARSSRPAWSPDGRRIALAIPPALYIVNADGSGETTVPDAFTMFWRASGITWSPDGSTLAFSGTILDVYDDAFTQVYLANADGTNVRRYTDSLTYSPANTSVLFAEGNPAWSPDGRHIAYWSFAYGLTVADLNARGAYSVSHDNAGPRGGTSSPSVGFGANPDWSPNAEWIVYQQNGQLFVRHADAGGKPRQLTSITGGAATPAWVR